jgi:hypothetical protein
MKKVNKKTKAKSLKITTSIRWSKVLQPLKCEPVVRAFISAIVRPIEVLPNSLPSFSDYR